MRVHLAPRAVKAAQGGEQAWGCWLRPPSVRRTHPIAAALFTSKHCLRRQFAPKPGRLAVTVLVDTFAAACTGVGGFASAHDMLTGHIATVLQTPLSGSCPAPLQLL